MHVDPGPTEMRTASPTAFKACGPRPDRTRGRVWLPRLMFLIILAVYIPLEAFDGDPEVGFDEAMLLTASSCITVTPNPPAPPGPRPPQNLPSVRFSMPAAEARVAPGPNNEGRGRLVCLRVSLLCARSRIAEPATPLEPHGSTLNRTHANALASDPRVAARAFVL